MSAVDAPMPLIILDPDVLDGQAVVAGTRISVELILRELSMGVTYAELLQSYPTLTEPGIRAALTYAAEDRIVVDKDVMFGRPRIKGTRVTVETILRGMSEGATVADLLADYPHIVEADMHAALAYARAV